MEKLIIFTDLDGTLLDANTYSFEEAMPAIEMVRAGNIPMVLCSSKTKSEILYYREKLGNAHPFISENGGGIFIPKRYFDGPLRDVVHAVEEGADFDVIRLGARYSDLRNAIKELRDTGFEIMGFGDMTPQEISAMTGMNLEEAIMAKERDFDEPFIYRGPSHGLSRLFGSIIQKGFKFTQGRFFHILGSSNKGTAVSILTDLYRRKYGDIRTMALGDSPNDIPMLGGVDVPILVQKPGGIYDPQIDMPNLKRAGGVGPDGWNKALSEFLGCSTG